MIIRLGKDGDDLYGIGDGSARRLCGSDLCQKRPGIQARGLAPANKVGVIDSDYRGEIMVALHNHSEEAAVISHGERIAQLIITPYLTAEFTEKECWKKLSAVLAVLVPPV